MNVGTDIVSVERLERIIGRFGDAFLSKFFDPREIRYCNAKAHPAVHFAGKYAAKESVGKALELTWSDGFSWRQIAIINDDAGIPRVELSGRVLELAEAAGIRAEDISISVSHCEQFAVAVAMCV